MAQITIETSGCRSCSLCAEICPTDVFDLSQADGIATAARPQDCIGCTSCEYICPSRCLSVSDVDRQLPLFRLEQNTSLVARLLQQTPLAISLTADDVDRALRDVSVRLSALSDSITETMGRGHKVVGRKAGQLAAHHLPELYEGRSLAEVLDRMRQRFAGSFDFVADIAADESEVHLRFEQCALAPVVRAAGQSEGSAVLCGLFHEYWAGLLGACCNRSFGVTSGSGGTCSIQLRSRN